MVIKFYTPLRYPGGKRKLFSLISRLLEYNGLLDGHYVEPYAGGAGLALMLMQREFMRVIHLNDFDRSIYAFWYSVMNHTDDFCKQIELVEITLEERKHQLDVQANKAKADLFKLGFSTFYLNRVNRSGIISGGVIGGKNQDGKWKITARFNKDELIQRIRLISTNRSRVKLYNMDAIDFLKHITMECNKKTMLYLDPPYYVKGKELYSNFYDDLDHEKVSKYIQSMDMTNWIVSYDNVDKVRDFYHGRRFITYDLSYSAGVKHRGSEIMFFSDNLEIPEIEDFESLHNVNVDSLYDIR